MAIITPKYAGEPVTKTSGPSGALWADCPVAEMILDPGIGYYYFDDFVGPLNPTSAKGYTVTAVTSGSILHTDATGGALLVDSGGNATADDGVNVQILGESWTPAAQKTLWFEARVKFSDVATTPDQFLIGLSETDTTLIASGALDEANTSMIAFYTDVNSTAASLEFITNKAASVEIDTAIATVANATYYKLGFKVDTTLAGALRVIPFVDGVEQTADIVTDTDDIPIVAMTLSMVAQCEQTSADAEMTIDWVRIAQLR